MEEAVAEQRTTEATATTAKLAEKAAAEQAAAVPAAKVAEEAAARRVATDVAMAKAEEEEEVAKLTAEYTSTFELFALPIFILWLLGLPFGDKLMALLHLVFLIAQIHLTHSSHQREIIAGYRPIWEERRRRKERLDRNLNHVRTAPIPGTAGGLRGQSGSGPPISPRLDECSRLPGPPREDSTVAPQL